MFTLQPVDGDFFDTAPVRHVLTVDIERPAADVWAELTGDSPLWWCRTLDIAWTSPRPFGVGTTRTARVLRGALTIQEDFFRWEEGRRKSFSVLRANLPFFRRFGEDYLLEPVGTASCRLTWTIALEPSAAGRFGGAVNRLLINDMFRDTRRHFTR